jgi:MarR-like DNA-binding transcriptional regulator SgrR of sgrS sRNA
MRISITEKQRKILNEIKRIKASGYEPTYAELARTFNCTKGNIRVACLTMQSRGYIKIEGIEVGKKGKTGRLRFVILEKSIAAELVSEYIKKSRSNHADSKDEQG